MSRTEPRPSPRRQRLSGAERRDRILAAAVECFASRGFSGTTTREVAARADITEAGLYRHFPSKEALYDAIIDAKMQTPDVVTGVREAASRSDDRAVLGGVARIILERSLADPAFVRILFFSALEGHALAEPFFEARIRRLREFLEEYIRQRVDDGAFRPVEPRFAARAFLGMVMDLANVDVVFGWDDLGGRTPAESSDTFVDLFLSGIQSGPDAAQNSPNTPSVSAEPSPSAIRPGGRDE